MSGWCSGARAGAVAVDGQTAGASILGIEHIWVILK